MNAQDQLEARCKCLLTSLCNVSPFSERLQTITGSPGGRSWQWTPASLVSQALGKGPEQGLVLTMSLRTHGKWLRIARWTFENVIKFKHASLYGLGIFFI